MSKEAIESTTKYLYPHEPSRFTLRELDRLLTYYVDLSASDITLQTNDKIMAEVYGNLYRVTNRALTNAEISGILNSMYGANGTAQILSGKDVDTNYEVRPARGIRFRFRVNATGCTVEGVEGIQITLRSIPLEPPKLAEMELPERLVNSIIPAQGIVIVAGSTGSGKSTLLASIMREILETKHGKILSYEAPIEFVYDNIVSPHSSISQSEIPLHLKDFPTAVRNAMRRKPKYILVGEARDPETIGAVVDAALTGHTVYTTVHSNGVADTMRRMVAAFPQEERYARMVDLLTLTRAIVWQTLVPTVTGQRVALREWLVLDADIREKLLANTNEGSLFTVLNKEVQVSGNSLLLDVAKNVMGSILKKKD
jgi:defect-in-organelle-trafficking protein DotB